MSRGTKAQRELVILLGYANCFTDLGRILADWVARHIGEVELFTWVQDQDFFTIASWVSSNELTQQDVEPMAVLLPDICAQGSAVISAENFQELFREEVPVKFKGKQFLGVAIPFLGEIIGVIVLMNTDGFTELQQSILQSINPYFAVAMTTAGTRSKPEESGKKPTTDKQWWQTGRDPPFYSNDDDDSPNTA
jgi:hypothetical protein